jgi:hypothetical protein
MQAESLDPTDWWACSLKESVDKRRAAHQRCKLFAIQPTLCATCKKIDFEYLYFGDVKTGFRRNPHEGLCLGTLASVHRRATQGCPFCADILLPEAQKILDIQDPRTTGKSGLTLPLDALSLHLEVSDILFSRDALTLHRSGGIYLSVRQYNQHSAINDGPRIVDERDKPFAETGPISRFCICLIDHDLSAYRLLRPLIDLKLCKHWLQRCFDLHEKCKGQQRQPGAATVRNPSFKLIDVRSRSVLNIGVRQSVRYATLSYVCGPAYTVRVLKDSDGWDRDENGILRHALPQDLPKTLEDALTVTTGIGLRYLWVDSICIAQDDADEKRSQIEAMYHIYADATVCIVAAPGEDSLRGLPGVNIARTQPRSIGVLVREGILVGIPRPPLSEIIKPYRWMGRAWTYQELILSKRCLIFTENEAFFYCASSTFKESEIEDAGGSSREQWADSASSGYRIGNSSIMLAAKAEAHIEEVCRMYKAAVEEYTRRALSYQTDGLNAFQGLATFLGSLLESNMTYGCPTRMLSNCLTWRPESVIAPKKEWPQRRMVRDEASGQDDNHLCPMFPSWAWVAWKGASRIQLMPYFFWGSEMKILDTASFSRIPSSANLRHRFRTTQVNDHRGLGFLEGIIPVIAKMGHFQVATSEDAPGHVDILTMDEEYAGSCDVRGALDTENLQKCEASLIQIWVEHNKGKGSNCNVMLVKLHDFPGKDQNQQRDLVKALAEQSLGMTKISDATAQHMNEDAKFRKKMEGDCPNSLIVRYPSKGLQLSNTFLASRLGVGYVYFDKWMKCDLKDALLFLG